MTFAWYGHLKNLDQRAWLLAALVELGHRAVRVPAAGAGQPHRLRRRHHAGAAQDHAGSDHAGGVRAVRGVLHGPAAQARLSCGPALCLVGAVYFIFRSLMSAALALQRFRHIAIEGPIGAGKSTLARLLAPHARRRAAARAAATRTRSSNASTTTCARLCVPDPAVLPVPARAPGARAGAAGHVRAALIVSDFMFAKDRAVRAPEPERRGVPPVRADARPGGAAAAAARPRDLAAGPPATLLRAHPPARHRPMEQRIDARLPAARCATPTADYFHALRRRAGARGRHRALQPAAQRRRLRSACSSASRPSRAARVLRSARRQSPR